MLSEKELGEKRRRRHEWRADVRAAKRRRQENEARWYRNIRTEAEREADRERARLRAEYEEQKRINNRPLLQKAADAVKAGLRKFLPRRMGGGE